MRGEIEGWGFSIFPNNFEQEFYLPCHLVNLANVVLDLKPSEYVISMS